MKQLTRLFTLALFFGTASVVLFSCQKMSRPKLGAYPQDSNPPGGPLKFFASFDGTTTNPLFNAVDSIRANFPQRNDLASIPGVSGRAVQGDVDKVVVYPSTNDLTSSTSFSIAYWIKNTPQARTEFIFSLVDGKYGWHNSACYLLIENQTATKATVKLGLMDQWLEFVGANEYQKPIFDGNWHHMAFVYDETTSKMKYYFDGAEYTGNGASTWPASITDVRNGGSPRGAVDFSTVRQLVIGGWNKHASLAGPTDGWIGTFTGGIDQFRLYGKALTAAEVSALFTGRK